MHLLLMGKAFEGLGFDEQAKLYYVKVIRIAQQEKRLASSRFCGKIIAQAKESLKNLSNSEPNPTIFGVKHSVRPHAEEEFESRMMREGTQDVDRPALCTMYISKPKNKATVN